VPSEQVTRQVMLIGVGYHAKDVYLPALSKLRNKYPIQLTAIADFDYVLGATTELCDNLGFKSLARIPVTAFTANALPTHLAQRLSAAVKHHNIRAVIISTPPEVHRAYALWAMDSGLDILIDKPITTRANAAFDYLEAREIYTDYTVLLEKYRHIQDQRNTAFLVHTPRRYNPAFDKMIELITEVRDQTGSPVTALTSSHSDGQWRLPNELLDLDYHGYTAGIGVISHTGYHIIDIALRFLEAGQTEEKRPDRLEVFSTFITPAGYQTQLTQDDYLRIIPEYGDHNRYKDEELALMFSKFGEIDANVAVSLWKDHNCIGNVTLQLLHGGFSQRSDLNTNYTNLYKGMGRLNHEYHFIHQGPFQTVQMLSFQSKSPQFPSEESDFLAGGNNHREIHVFRNELMLDSARYTSMALNDLMPIDPSQSASAIAEHAVVEEFVKYLSGEVTKADLKSNLDTHWLNVCLMSAIYISNARRVNNGNPVVSLDLSAKTIVE
jgi:predicted dehydrogenase